MRRLLMLLLVGITSITISGCITNNNDGDTCNNTTIVIGFLTTNNEFMHGAWLIEIEKGTATTVEIMRTNHAAWEPIQFSSCAQGVQIFSTPPVLFGPGEKYRLTLHP
ncbi:MAG: hypothetical protein WC551_09350 [Patescibacteria group bacterium]